MVPASCIRIRNCSQAVSYHCVRLCYGDDGRLHLLLHKSQKRHGKKAVWMPDPD